MSSRGVQPRRQVTAPNCDGPSRCGSKSTPPIEQRCHNHPHTHNARLEEAVTRRGMPLGPGKCTGVWPGQVENRVRRAARWTARGLWMCNAMALIALVWWDPHRTRTTRTRLHLLTPTPVRPAGTTRPHRDLPGVRTQREDRHKVHRPARPRRGRRPGRAHLVRTRAHARTHARTHA